MGPATPSREHSKDRMGGEKGAKSGGIQWGGERNGAGRLQEGIDPTVMAGTRFDPLTRTASSAACS